jgi:hypothetical protein
LQIVNSAVILGIVFVGVAFAVAPQEQNRNLVREPKGAYSTCPDAQHAMLRSVGYVQATETELLKWAKTKKYPARTTEPETVEVQVQVDGKTVFCAQALSGSPEKQKVAVDAVMK